MHYVSLTSCVVLGMKDDVQYSVSGLDMSGIKIRKENVTVEIGNSLTDEFITFTITGLGAIFEGIYWRFGLAIVLYFVFHLMYFHVVGCGVSYVALLM